MDQLERLSKGQKVKFIRDGKEFVGHILRFSTHPVIQTTCGRTFQIPKEQLERLSPRTR